jgi:hypothetical protein
VKKEFVKGIYGDILAYLKKNNLMKNLLSKFVVQLEGKLFSKPLQMLPEMPKFPHQL